MVHLATVTSKAAAEKPVLEGLDSKKFFPEQEEDAISGSVYGSRFAAQDLPKYEIPENEMPKEIAYRMIK